MKKAILAIAIMCGALTMASAQTAATKVSETISYKINVSTLTVSTMTATQVDGASNVLNQRTFIEVQNLDTTNAIYCKHDNTATVNGGRKIAKGEALKIKAIATSIAYGRISLYCIAESTPVIVSVMQGY